MDFLKKMFADNLPYIAIVLVVFISKVISQNIEEEGAQTFNIEGKVEVVSTSSKDWISNTQVLVDGGVYIGHLR